MSLSPLPFSKIPQIPFEIIFKNVDVIDIFSFSFISNKSRTLLRETFRLNVDSIEFRFCSDEHFIKIKTSESRKFKILIKGNWRHPLRNALPGTSKNTKPFDAVTMNSPQTVNSTHLVIGCSTNAQFLEVSRILSDFTVTVFLTKNLNLQAMGYPKYDLFRFVRFWARSFKKLHILNRYEEFYEEDLRILLENVQVDNFYIFVESADLKFRRPLQHRKMQVSRGTWLTLDCLLEMRTIQLMAYDVVLTTNEINVFIKKWISGGLENMKKCVLNMDRNHMLDEGVLEGIETTEWHPPRNIAPFGENCRVDYYEAKCVEDCGGRYGVIWVKKEMVELHSWYRDAQDSPEL